MQPRELQNSSPDNDDIVTPLLEKESKKAIVSISSNQRFFADNKTKIKNHLQRLKKKHQRKKYAEFIFKYKKSLSILLSLGLGGVSFGFIWAFYYIPESNRISDLEKLMDLIHFTYDATQCPGPEYWYHPEATLACETFESSYHYSLLDQNSYCLVPDECPNDFPQQLIQKLPLLCLPIMQNFCEVLIDFLDTTAALRGNKFFLPIVPIILVLLSLAGSYYAFRRCSRLSKEENEDSIEILENSGLLEVVTQLDPSPGFLFSLENIYLKEEFTLHLESALIHMPKEIREIIIAYLNLPLSEVIQLRNLATRSLIWKDSEESNTELSEMNDNLEHKIDIDKDSFKSSRNKFATLFGKMKRTEDQEAVALRIFEFAGV